jgi:hypothetical protein
VALYGPRCARMLTAEKQVLLNGFLGQLPPRVALRLAEAVEVDRLIGGSLLPHEEILRALRPQLRRAPENDRVLTPLRLFVRPFEDLLIDGERPAKRKGRIPRTIVEPLWCWLGEQLMRERHVAFVESLKAAIVANMPEEIESILADFHREAAAALARALADGRERAAVAIRLGGVTALEDVREIAILLAAADEVTAIQRQLPKPIPLLSDDVSSFVRQTYERLVVANPELASYVPLIVMGRLERRWEVLRLAAAISGKSTDTLISNTDLGVAGENLLSDLDLYVSKIKTARPLDFDCEVLLANLAAFAELSSGMVKELQIRRDGRWGQRLAKHRADVSSTMETLIARAPKEVFTALPPPKSGVARPPRPLDLSRAPDPVKIERALRFARMLVHSRPFSMAAAFSARLNEVVDELSAELRSFSEDMLREMRSADVEHRDRAHRYFEVTVEISGLVLGEEEADFLRRRGRVAA